jgi:hypothetical protein
MNDASERFDKRSYRRLKLRCDLYSIHSRNGNELREAAGQSGDAVFAVELALMTVRRAAIVAQNFAAATDTIQTLVDHYSIAFVQISHRATDLLDYTGNLVAENLWLQSKRNRLSVFVCVVVCVAGEDVHVSAAKTDGGNANKHFVRRDDGARNIANLETVHVAQDARLHRLARRQLQIILVCYRGRTH